MEIIVVNERDNRTLNFSVNWGVLCLIICFIITIAFLFVHGVVNFARGRTDYKRLHQLTRENSIVQKEIEKMELEIRTLKVMLDTLIKKDTVMKYFSGLIPLESLIINHIHAKLEQGFTTGSPENIDELLKIAENQYLTRKAIIDYLNHKEDFKQSIPSIPPVNGWYIRGFGYTHDPFTGQLWMHEGIDIAAPEGTPVFAPGDGVVKNIQHNRDFGIVIEIDHQEGWKTVYAHCQRAAVRVGQLVKRGDLIGYVGMTGKCSGPHLHYEIRLNNIPVDPLDYIIFNF
ncbi:MAG: M23 family metallopeptidase [candidate division WOR-3 bacterium]|nr:M23 family metallopeptidase [candidate division WOR-3 bacterium]